MNKVDRELAQIEARRAAAESRDTAPRSGVRATLKRWTKDALVRRTSSKR